MVEEHSTDLTSRIESDYPNSSPAAVPSPACNAHKVKVTETLPVTTVGQIDVTSLKPTLGDDKIIDCDVDLKYPNDNKKNNNSNRPKCIESKRSKSLSVEINEEICKDDIKKTMSNPIKSEDSIADNEKAVEDSKEVEMTVEESITPGLKGSRSSLETRSDSPKPGCSSQPDVDQF